MANPTQKAPERIELPNGCYFRFAKSVNDERYYHLTQPTGQHFVDVMFTQSEAENFAAAMQPHAVDAEPVAPQLVTHPEVIQIFQKVLDDADGQDVCDDPDAEAFYWINKLQKAINEAKLWCPEKAPSRAPSSNAPRVAYHLQTLIEKAQGQVLGCQRSINAGSPQKARERIDAALGELRKAIDYVRALATPQVGGHG